MKSNVPKHTYKETSYNPSKWKEAKLLIGTYELIPEDVLAKARTGKYLL